MRRSATGRMTRVTACVSAWTAATGSGWENLLFIWTGPQASLCLDHHVTNTGYGECSVVEAGASSTCEVLFGQMDEKYIDKSVAECLYTGIVHDTGVFKFPAHPRKPWRLRAASWEKAWILEILSMTAFTGRPTYRIRFWGGLFLRVLPFWTNTRSSVPSGRMR